MSPGYPLCYPIITCTLEIVVPVGYIMVINLADFEISCAEDSKLLVGEEAFCGLNKPFSPVTFKSDLKIQMVSKEAQTNRGFRATFSMTERGPHGK